MVQPRVTRKRVLAAKAEDTPGTAEDLSASEAAFNVFEPETNPGIDFEEREGQGSFSPLAGVPGPRMGTIRFSLELTGSGDAGDPAPLWAETFLPACGWGQTDAVFAPTSLPPEAAGSKAKTLTIGMYEDGKLKKLRGCMGTFTITCPTGKRILIEFTFTGVWVAPLTDEALLTPTYPTVSPLRFAATTFTIGSWTPKCRELTFDAGNTVVMREDPTAVEGYSMALVTGRRVTGSLDPETSLVAQNDQQAAWLARTEAALSLLVGGGSANGNRCTIAAPKLQWTNIQEADRDGVMTDALEFQCNRSASAGDDELTLTFS